MLIDQEMAGIKEALRLEATSTAHSFYSMLFVKDKLHTRRRIVLGGGIQVMQKFTGIDFIATYAPEMFTLSGFSGDTPALLAGGNFISYGFSLALAIYLSDRIGRRTSMLWGSALMGIILIVGAVLSRYVLKYSTSNPVKANHLGAGVAAVLYIYTALYGSTWLTTCWVYPTEVFPLATRAKGTALATVAFSLAGGTINEIVPYLITATGYWVFVLFVLLNFLILVPVWLFYIETANRDLEDMVSDPTFPSGSLFEIGADCCLQDLLFSGDSVFAWRAERQFAMLKESQREGIDADVMDEMKEES